VHARPDLVVDSEMEYRRTLGYPPFGALAELTGDADALNVATEGLRDVGLTVFGPTDGRALAHAADFDALADGLLDALPAARAMGRVRAAVDPPRA
jgi:hypothetical protein